MPLLRTARWTLLALAFLSGSLIGQASFSLDDILSAPFPSTMSAAPSGGHLAWVMNERGARNLWLASPPDYAANRWTEWSEDDGLTISDLSWNRSGSQLLFVRGDGANRQGEFPNPRNLPGGTDQSIWKISVGGQAERLTEGNSPQFLPDDSGILFNRRGEIWQLLFAEEAKPEQLIKARGSAAQLEFSPDGKQLAFSSRRGDHSYIALYDLSEKTLRYLDPTLDSDNNPVWSADGAQLAHFRFPAQRQGLIFTPEREAPPWEIRVIDVASGRSHQVFKARPGAGSAFRGIVSSSQLFFSSDGYLVFPWERNGWTQLYSVPATGGDPIHLTPGEFEVEYVSTSADGRDVIYNSNQDDIDRRHLWKVGAAGGTPIQLTRGESNEWNPAPASQSGVIGLIQSTGTQPARPALLRNGEFSILAPESLPATFPTAQLVEPQQVIFSAADGMPIHGQLFVPPGDAHKPAMLYFHGGSRRQMLLGFHYSNYYHNAYAMNQYLANQGYVVLSVNYRSGIGYGMEFREALNYGAAGASEFNDVLGAGLYLRGRADVDGNRIGLWGGSYGGYLTALGLARASHLFAAGVDIHGVHDWNEVIRNFVPSYEPLKVAEAARLAFESSPLASMDTWTSPVLLIHGDDDRNVPFSESVHLVEELRKRGIVYEQLVFPDEVHGFLLHESWLAAFEKSRQFLERHLKQRVREQTEP